MLLQAGDSSSDAAGDELDVTTPTGAGATSTATTAARPGSAASKVQARSEMEWSRLAQLHSPFGDSGAHDGRSKLPSASQVLKAQADDEDAAFSESRTASTATSSSESERDCEDCAQCRHCMRRESRSIKSQDRKAAERALLKSKKNEERALLERKKNELFATKRQEILERQHPEKLRNHNPHAQKLFANLVAFGAKTLLPSFEERRRMLLRPHLATCRA